MADYILKRFNGSAWENMFPAASILRGNDTRSSNSAPSFYQKSGAGLNTNIVTEFKQTTTIGLTTAQTGSTYVQLNTYTPYPDASGGLPIQIALCQNGKFFRRVAASETVWGAWSEVGGASGGTALPLYRHDILLQMFSGSMSGMVSLTIYSYTQTTAFTLTTLEAWLTNNGYTTSSSIFACSGSLYTEDPDSPWQPIWGVFRSGTTFTVYYGFMDSVNITSKSLESVKVTLVS